MRGRAARTYANMKKPLLQAEQLVSEKLSEAKEDLNQADRATRKPTPSTHPNPHRSSTQTSDATPNPTPHPEPRSQPNPNLDPTPPAPHPPNLWTLTPTTHPDPTPGHAESLPRLQSRDLPSAASLC